MYVGDNQQLGALGASKLKRALQRYAAQQAAQRAAAARAAEEARMKALIAEQLPSVEERAKAIAEAIAARQKAEADAAAAAAKTAEAQALLAKTTMPVAPPRMWSIPRGEIPPRAPVVRPAAPVSYAAPSPRPPAAATVPVDSKPGFPLMEQWRQAQKAGVPSPAFDAGEPPALPPEKKGPGIGTVLLLAAPILLATMAG